MFEYFPGNYVWNFALSGVLSSGGLIDEVDRASRPIRDAAAQGQDAGTEEFLASWTAVIDRLERQADAERAAGHLRSAGQKYFRAVNYLITAERMQSADTADRNAIYRRVLGFAQSCFETNDPWTSRVTIPFGETTLPAYFMRADRADGTAAPTMIMFNGLDSTKEHMYTSGFAQEMRARGISTLMVDCPGSGEALRLQGLVSQIESEQWATACVDYLLTRDDVDPSLVGLVGWSLGGYYAPRAAAFEKRLVLVVAWGANHNWGAVQRARVNREGELPVPHYWRHVMWVWGFDDKNDFLDFADDVNLDGVVENITVPFLITHGENDRQIPLDYAHRTYEQAVNSPKRELRVFSSDEGANEHIGLDNMNLVMMFTADWVEDTFAELKGANS